MARTFRRISLIASSVVVFTVSVMAAELVQQRNARVEDHQVLTSGTLSELAIFLANHGMSAGVIARSPASTNVVPPTDRGQRAAEWLNERRLTPDDLLVSPGESITAREALLRFSTTHQGQLQVRTADLVPVIADEGAVACERILQRPMRAEIGAGNIIDALAALVNGTSPGSAARGWVGSCEPVGSEMNGAKFAVNGPLETGLNELAARVDGAVWYAVDNGLGGCSVGLIAKRARAAGACQVMLAPDVR